MEGPDEEINKLIMEKFLPLCSSRLVYPTSPVLTRDTIFAHGYGIFASAIFG